MPAQSNFLAASGRHSARTLYQAFKFPQIEWLRRLAPHGRAHFPGAIHHSSQPKLNRPRNSSAEAGCQRAGAGATLALSTGGGGLPVSGVQFFCLFRFRNWRVDPEGGLVLWSRMSLIAFCLVTGGAICINFSVLAAAGVAAARGARCRRLGARGHGAHQAPRDTGRAPIFPADRQGVAERGRAWQGVAQKSLAGRGR